MNFNKFNYIKIYHYTYFSIYLQSFKIFYFKRKKQNKVHSSLILCE